MSGSRSLMLNSLNTGKVLRNPFLYNLNDSNFSGLLEYTVPASRTEEISLNCSLGPSLQLCLRPASALTKFMQRLL